MDEEAVPVFMKYLLCSFIEHMLCSFIEHIKLYGMKYYPPSNILFVRGRRQWRLCYQRYLCPRPLEPIKARWNEGFVRHDSKHCLRILLIIAEQRRVGEQASDIVKLTNNLAASSNGCLPFAM